MKYLSHYIEAAQSALLDKHGVFFAFSKEQFEESKKDGIEYEALGAGMLAPKGCAKAIDEGLTKISEEGRKQDLAENGKEAIIDRELSNYECFYSGSPADAMASLRPYGFTEEEINIRYRIGYLTADL